MTSGIIVKYLLSVVVGLVRAYFAFFQLTSEVYFNLAFPNIHIPNVFALGRHCADDVHDAKLIVVTTTVRKPGCQPALIRDRIPLVHRQSKPGMALPVYVVVFMRWLAKLTASISFRTLYSLASSRTTSDIWPRSRRKGSNNTGDDPYRT